MTDNYVCRDHPSVVLVNVRQIRADIGRPTGVNVVGECEECRRSKNPKKPVRAVLSYGVRPSLTLQGAPNE